MPRLLLISCFFLIPLFLGAQSLQVSNDRTHLVDENGEPFVWIGDTAWELFHKLNREEATTYLENRAEQGFNVIQAVVLAENAGLRRPNPYGAVPLKDLDPTRPNEAYFEHVDFIVNKAEALGLTIGMLPTWGDKVPSENKGGPVVFDSANAYTYGKFLGDRYRDDPIVWILGGDRKVMNQEVKTIWDQMAQGIIEGGNEKQLMTYHPRGTYNSATWFHDAEWLDFNMYQSGHEKFNKVYEYAEDNVMHHPRKPFIDGEPAYEDIPVRFWEYMDFSQTGKDRVPEGILQENGIISDKSHFESGFITAYDVRVHAYWNFLSGACGYTYGNNAIWQMFKKDGNIAIPTLTDWKAAMDRPGSKDMVHVKNLFLSRPFGRLVPDQSIIYGENPGNNKHIRAAKGSEGFYLIAYASMGQPLDIVMDNISGKNAMAWWYNPRNGGTRRIGEYQAKGITTFTPPSEGLENDWVLVIDSSDASFETPGEVN